MHITVPSVPDGSDAGWRKWLTGTDDRVSRTGKPKARGGEAALGPFLSAGDIVDIPAGALILIVDKRTTGWERSYYGKRYPAQSATVAIHLVTEDGLHQLWTRHYTKASSAFGAATRTKAARLLAEHPVPDGEVTVVTEARRPNRTRGTCRWCGATIPAGQGHLVGHGENAEVEHYQDCPPRYGVIPGEGPCVLCGVTVTDNAYRVLVREGVGRWEIRHHDYLRCTERQLTSYQERQAKLAVHNRAVAEQKENDRKRAEANARRRERERRKREEKKAAALATERARVASRREVSRTTKTIREKNADLGRRAYLREHTLTLDDGTTTTRWDVHVTSHSTGFNGEDYDPDPGETSPETDVFEDALDAYRAHAPQRIRRSGQWVEVPQTGDVPCPPDGRKHCDHCGATESDTGSSETGWMSASLGRACGTDCYDAMADARGAHARMYHSWRY